MNLKKASYGYLMSIPHIADLWEKRKYQRYEPQDDLDIEIKLKDEKLSAQLMDISYGGMRITSTDTRMKDLTSISLSIDEYCIELPCEKIRKHQNNYGFAFGSMDNREASKLGYFIENCTKEVPRPGPTEIMR